MTRSLWAALISGLLFGVGLAMSEMTDPQRVLGFLDIFGDFDPALLFVLGGAVAVTSITFRLVFRRQAPVLADTFQISHLQAVDRQLLGGAALFGIGWGIAGYCPGPALAGLVCCHRKHCGSYRRWWPAPSSIAPSRAPDYHSLEGISP